jgi:hypothetical protein
VSNREPRLSVVMVAGECRDRAQRALDGLCAQTAREAMEIVVVDLAGENASALAAPQDAPVEILRLPGSRSGRSHGVRGSSAPPAWSWHSSKSTASPSLAGRRR